MIEGIRSKDVTVPAETDLSSWASPYCGGRGWRTGGWRTGGCYSDSLGGQMDLASRDTVGYISSGVLSWRSDLVCLQYEEKGLLVSRFTCGLERKKLSCKWKGIAPR